MMYASPSDSWLATSSCWWAGNMSRMRVTVPRASRVCSVENTRWPVSAAVSVHWAESRSRISPTKITSGSSRRQSRRPRSKLCTFRPTSRCDTSARLLDRRYSMGSSSVMMRQARDSAMRSMSAATVVDLPAPVMPVSSTRPCCAARMSCHTWLGNPICSTAIGAASSARMAITGPSLSKKAFSRKHRTSVAKEPSTERCSSSAASSALVNRAAASSRMVGASSGAPSRNTNRPSTRYTGGEPAFRCRSDTRMLPPCCVKYCNSSRMEIALALVAA